jgi:plastocyanin
MSASSYRDGALIAILSVVLSSCGDSASNGPSDQVLTSVAVSPSTATIFNTAPGNTVLLTGTALDQNGATIAGLGTPSFESSNLAVAIVSASGMVTAVAAGSAQITATFEAGGHEATGTMSVTVQNPPAVALVGVTSPPQMNYSPSIVHLSTGGQVSWTFGAIHHTVTFTSPGSPADIPELVNAGASRTFPTAGTFNYVCDFHAAMTGTVYVH